MITFLEFLDINSIKKIVFNSLGIDQSKINDANYLSTNLSDFDSRKKILQVQAIRSMPEFNKIQQMINVNASNYTIGTLVDAIERLSSLISDED